MAPQLTPGIRRFLRYSLIGFGTFLFDLLLLFLATSAGVPYFLATPITFLIAVSINYAISRHFVFKGTERPVGHGYMYFAGIALAGAAVTTMLVVALVQYLALHYVLARIIVAGVIGIAGYLFNLHFNFKVAGRHL